MAVSGCKLSCAESWVRDIGLMGHKNGWILTLGGNVVAKPRIGQPIVEGLNDNQALAAIDQIVARYQNQAKKGERLGKMIDRVGLEPFKFVVAN